MHVGVVVATARSDTEGKDEHEGYGSEQLANSSSMGNIGGRNSVVL